MLSELRKKVLLTAIVLAISGCTSDAYDFVIPEDVSAWSDNEGFEKAVESLPDSDREKFTQYVRSSIIRKAFGGGGIKAGSTIGDVIELVNADKLRTEEKDKAREAEIAASNERKEHARQLQQDMTDKMNSHLDVSLLSLQFKPMDIRSGNVQQDRFVFDLSFNNTSDTAISGIKGVVVLKNIFGDTLRMFSFTDDTHVSSGSSYVYKGQIKHNKYLSEHAALRSADPSKVTLEWIPVAYIFENGEILELKTTDDILSQADY